MTKADLESQAKDFRERFPSANQEGCYNTIFRTISTRGFPVGAREPSDYIKDKLRGRTLIDIGEPSINLDVDNLEFSSALALFAMKSGCRRYIALDPFHGGHYRKQLGDFVVETHPVDGLTYLLQPSVKDNSAVIVANGLFRYDGPFRSACRFPFDDELDDYCEKLVAQIARVTPNIFFGNGGMHDKFRAKFYYWMLEDVLEDPFEVERMIFGNVGDPEWNYQMFLLEKNTDPTQDT